MKATATAQSGPGTATADTATNTTATTTFAAPETTTTTPPAAGKAPGTATLVDGGGKGNDVASSAAATWPNDWRNQLAGDDKAALEQLARYGSPKDVWAKARALEQKLSSGEYKRELPKDAKPQEVAAWRAERGIPAKPEGYKIELPKGVVLGEADKPVVDAFTKDVHAKNWSNQQVNEALAWYYNEQDRQKAAQAEADLAYKQKSEDALRAEFGPEFRPNLNAVNNLMAALPEETVQNFWGGRLADGSRIGDNPAVLKWLAGLSRELNPVATLVPAGISEGGKGLNDRIAEIEKMMGDHSSDYWRGSKANDIQAEYRTLLDVRERTGGKTRAA